MPSQKPPEAEKESRPSAISDDASDWVRQFVKHFELNFLDACRDMPAQAGSPDYHHATISALFQTLLDSGMNAEEIVEDLGRLTIQQRPGFEQWNSALNQRRFELIDKEIQETLTPAEKIELAGLTNIMREQLDSEANLPLEGGKALHRKLLELDAADKAR